MTRTITTAAALAFVSDVQKVINDDAGDDPDPSWVYDRLVGSLAVIDNLTAVLHAPAPAPSVVPEAAPSATRDEVAGALQREFGCFLARDPQDRDRFWGGAADALLARYNITPKETDR